MALGTKYKRNVDNGEKQTQTRVDAAKEMAREIKEKTGCSFADALEQACNIILRRENWSVNIRDAQIITEINATRSRYGFGPVQQRDEQEAVEDRRCDEIARLWMRSCGGAAEGSTCAGSSTPG